jgi:hypothetical protein
MQPLKTINIVFGFLMLLFAGSILAQDITPPVDTGIPPEDFERIAQSGWQFLKVPVNARMAGMGGVATGIGKGDANSIFNNPAELTGVEGYQLAANTVQWFADITTQSLALAGKLGNMGTFGISFLALDYGDMKRTEYMTVDDPAAPTGQRNVIDDNLGTFTAADMAIGLSYAKQITDRLSFGANFRYLRSEIDDLSMTNWSFDVGTVYYTGFKSMRIAMLARNFGPDRKLVDYNEEIRREPASIKMPVQFRVGAAIDLLEGIESPHLLTLAVEGLHPNDGPEKLNVGVEYTLFELFRARGGYKFNYDEESYTFGAGLNLSIDRTKLMFDYAFVDFGNLDTVQMFSLGLGF